MEQYKLKNDEVVLFEKSVQLINSQNSLTNMILTNFSIVFENTKRIGLFKTEKTMEQYPVKDIKIYDGKPQVVKSNGNVVIYLTNGELTVHFYSAFDSSKFINAINTLIIGEGAATRGAEKVKKALSLVDDTLGISVTGAVSGVLENGVVKTLFKGVGKKSKNSLKKSNSSETVAVVANAATEIAKTVKGTENNSEETMDQCIESVKKLKELLDIGAITQEEFDVKKKEILGL